MGSLQRSFTVLFAIGLCECLGLEVDAPNFMPRCQEALLRIHLRHASFQYGTITLYGRAFQPTSRR